MDDNDSKVYRTFFVCGTVLLLGSIGSCQATNYQIRKAIESGANPLSVSCALTEDQCDILEAAEAESLRDK